jgi:hypothetical protein
MLSKRVMVVLYACCAALLIGLLLFPVRSGAIRLLIIASAVVAIFGAPLFLRSNSARIVVLSMMALACGAITFLPGRSPSVEQLRPAFVEALRRYEGDRYVWGGENARGVDCSGIVRAAWFDAHMRLGLGSANPQLVRDALSIWWFDASAKELSAGYGGRTRALHSARSIRANNDEGLLPGDFAIVARGVHALAYLGNQTWIEADPGARKVIVIKTSDANAWLDSSAVFVRWTELNRNNGRP